MSTAAIGDLQSDAAVVLSKTSRLGGAFAESLDCRGADFMDSLCFSPSWSIQLQVYSECSGSDRQLHACCDCSWLRHAGEAEPEVKLFTTLH